MKPAILNVAGMLCVAALLFMLVTVSAGSPPPAGKYKIKSGIITMTTDGPINSKEED